MSMNLWNPGEYLEQCKRLDSDEYPISTILQKMDLTAKLCRLRDHQYGLIESISLCLQDSCNVRGDDQLLTYLSAMNISVGVFEDLVCGIKQLIIDEIRTHWDVYEEYVLPSGDLNTLFDFFPMTDASFFGCILQAAANVLHTIIVLIPRCYGMSFLPIIPHHGIALWKVFYLHYYPDTSTFTSLVEINASTEDIKCKCGIRDKIIKSRCGSDP